MLATLNEIVRYRELLTALTARELRARYKQSVMGFLWAILMPAIIISTGLVVRLVLSRVSGEAVSGKDIAAIAVKSLPWAFFVASMRAGTLSLVSNNALVTKIKFPRLVFPLAAVLSALVDMAVATPVVVLTLIIIGIPLTWNLLWVPVLLVVLILFTVGITVLTSAANLFFRDVKYLVEVVMTFAIFFTPVLYDSSMAGSYRSLLLINPVAPVLEGLKDAVVLGQPPELGWMAYSIAAGIIIFTASVGFFHRLEPRFAESV